MSSPRVSVLIPAYNQANYLCNAIQSVLDQTYPNFELIVVNDASTDNTADVVARFRDPRIRYILHNENCGLPATRNTGIRASSGDYVALLDADDFYHPDKLRMHIDFMESHPDIGVTYNSRFELNHSANTIRELWRPPLTVSLSDLVVGFPFAPSDLLIRKEWLFRVGLFDETYTFYGEDLDMNCRLALAGCRFASVDRSLNYRRHHSGKKIRNIASGLETIIGVLTKTFADPRCSPDVLAHRKLALSIHYMLWSIIAFDQNETALGKEFCLKAVQLNSSILDGDPCLLFDSILSYSLYDDSRDHEEILRRVFEQLPVETVCSQGRYDWGVAHGYLVKGTRAVMWGRTEKGQRYFDCAATSGAQLDEIYLNRISTWLLDYAAEFGADAAENILHEIVPLLGKIGTRSRLDKLQGNYLVNRAFQSYHKGKYDQVPRQVLLALSYNPKYLANRGVLAILIRSIGNRVRQTMFA